MKKSIVKLIAPIIGEDVVLEKPKDITLGHYATPVAFLMAKKLKTSPMQIANDLALKLKQIDIFEDVKAINGYINFTLSKSFLNKFAIKCVKNSFTCKEEEQSVLIEYVSANPTGPLHIGHARGAVVGDSLCRVGEHLGYQISSEYYVNDSGNQIHLLGLSIFMAGQKDILNLQTKQVDECYKGEYITKLAYLACEDFGSEVFEDEKNIKILSNWGKDKMLVQIKEDLQKVNINIKNYVSEKAIYKKANECLERLKLSGNTYEQDGKIWIKSSLLGDEKDRVIIRDDQRATYLAGDIVYHDDKFARKYDSYINIWGADHHGYIARVKAAINFLGYDEKKLEVILIQMVSLLQDGEPYKMSKRAGKYILMSDVVDEIGSDALRFIFLSKKCDTHLEFDVQSLKKQDSSNPIYYINYAHARINQLYKKAKISVEDVLHVGFDELTDDGTNLLFNALLLNEVLEDAFKQRQMQKVTEYLKYLSSLFHKFYNEHKVIGTQNEQMYLKLFSVVGVCINKGLELIGIKAQDVM